MMRRHLPSDPGLVPRRAALGLLVAGLLAATACDATAALVPMLRSPEGFVAAAKDARVLYEPGAEALAEAVVATLPAAITRIEAAEYGPFVVPVRLYVCATIACYRRFAGDALSAGKTTLRRRIFISPKRQNTPARMRFVVAHELAHLHLAQRLSLFRATQLPSWFNEGFAALASEGGGAEDVSDADATRAIVAGPRFTPTTERGQSGSHFGLSAHMFYRQSALFVASLRDGNGAAFRSFLLDLQGGAGFARAFQDHFGTDLGSAWRAFARDLTARAASQTTSDTRPTSPPGPLRFDQPMRSLPMKPLPHAVSVALLCSVALALSACGAGSGTSETAGAVTFWQDVAPIYADKCVRCHQAGGIGPFPLDDYATAKSLAATELARVQDGSMPPYHMVHDGTCGSFHDEATLDDAQRRTIERWVDGGMVEGRAASATPPRRPTLEGAVDVETPLFSPVAQGGALAADDEYRCFLLDAPLARDAFLAGYDVSPADASIVHHVLTFSVNPLKVTGSGQTNAAVMKALDAQSPERLGWPCFSGAGDGVEVDGVPVTWAPGQGVVNYPAGMGVPLHATDKLVVQIHYNLADPASAGKRDSTTVHLKLVDHVDRQLAFFLPDPFLDSLAKAIPDTLPPGKPDASYTWTLTGQELGLGGVPSVDLIAVMPHMHGRGTRQIVKMGTPGELACTSHLESWDFHWQEFYFYKQPPALTPSTQIQVTCEYDTSHDSAPVSPGWGTRNEMCLVVLMVALPPSR